MAVIVKYIVVRNGEEKMTFATKKEADAHDKMLDIADNLFEFLENHKVKLNEGQLENISLLMAQNREDLIPILRGAKPRVLPVKKGKADSSTQDNPGSKKEPKSGSRKSKSKK